MTISSDVAQDVKQPDAEFIPFAEQAVTRDAQDDSDDVGVLWEWTLARDSLGGSAGLCVTRHGAMEALSEALIASGRPRCGSVGRVKLRVDVVREQDCYERFPPEHTAVYEQGAVQWT
jgi:hypothetical protein